MIGNKKIFLVNYMVILRETIKAVIYRHTLLKVFGRLNNF